MAKCIALTLAKVCPIVLCAFISVAPAPGQTTDNPGAEVYMKHCASCHDQAAARMPSRSVLQLRTSAFIFKSLNTGIMKRQAAALSPPERMAVSQWLGRTTAAVLDSANVSNACKFSSPPAPPSDQSWTSWGNGLGNLRFQPAAAAGLSAAQAAHLKLKWAFGVPDVTAVRSQPAVYAGSILFAGGDTLYSLDASSGCTHWATELPAPVRSGISIGSPAEKPLAFFGDSAAGVYAVDVATGVPLWQVRADSHPTAFITGTPVYYEGKLFVPVASYEEAAATNPAYVCCTFRGSILALDARSGKTLWQTFTIEIPANESRVNKLGAPSKGPSGAAVWSAPTIDSDKKLIYVATGDNYSDPSTALSDAVLAISLDTGQIEWSRQFRAGDSFNVACIVSGSKNCPDANGPDFDFGSSPILSSLPGGCRALILAQKSGGVYAIDPDNRGKLLWQAQVGKGGVLGGVEWGPATDSSRLFVAVSDESFLPASPPTTDPAKAGNGSAASLQPASPPTIDPAKGGGLFAFSLKSGKPLWTAPPSPCDERKPCSPAQTSAVTAIPGVVFSGSLNGHLRAYSTADGKVLWDYDTGHEFKTVNGVPAHGGSISVAGPVVVGGAVYVLSGYDTFGEAGGNVLLVFTADGR
jgi:polyvinyl alcohol dehydrogenase (cytochrome)